MSEVNKSKISCSKRCRSRFSSFFPPKGPDRTIAFWKAGFLVANVTWTLLSFFVFK